jgi:hypothetical protein
MFRASGAINIFSDLYYPQTYITMFCQLRDKQDKLCSGAIKAKVQVMHIGTDPSSEP